MGARPQLIQEILPRSVLIAIQYCIAVSDTHKSRWYMSCEMRRDIKRLSFGCDTPKQGIFDYPQSDLMYRHEWDMRGI